MRNSSLYLLSFVICCQCAPHYLNITDLAGCDGECMLTQRDTVLGVLFAVAIVLLLWLLMRTIHAVHQSKKCNVPCHKYTSERRTTVEKVYGQLRSKWKAHEAKLSNILNSRFSEIYMNMDQERWSRVSQYLNDIKYDCEELNECFPSKKYKTSMMKDNHEDIASQFSRECRVLENYADNITALEKVMREKKTSMGMLGCLDASF